MRKNLIIRFRSQQPTSPDANTSLSPPMATVPSDKFPLAGLLVLSTAIFTSMATEFLPGGLIPLISDTFDRSSAEVGHLITLFALTVILTAAPLAVLTRRVDRKTIVLIAFGLIGLANVLTALAPSFEFLLGARVLGGLAHGLFWSVVAAYPAHLVRSSKLARAMAVTAAGGSLAGVAGIPLGNALGQAMGWRWAFGALACLAVIVTVLLARLLPPVKVPAGGTGAQARTSADRHGRTLAPILTVCFLILLIVAAQNSYGTYMVVWLVDIANFSMEAVPFILFAMGMSSAAGVALVGAFYSRFPLQVFLGALSTLVVLLLVLPSAAAAGSFGGVLALIIAMGTAFGALPTILQTRMMQSASPAARNMAAALQTTAFNIGIGGGAFLGGIVIASAETEPLGTELLPHFAALGMLLALLTAGIWEIFLWRARQREGGSGPLPRSGDIPY